MCILKTGEWDGGCLIWQLLKTRIESKLAPHMENIPQRNSLRGVSSCHNSRGYFWEVVNEGRREGGVSCVPRRIICSWVYQWTLPVNPSQLYCCWFAPLPRLVSPLASFAFSSILICALTSKLTSSPLACTGCSPPHPACLRCYSSLLLSTSSSTSLNIVLGKLN